MIYFLFLLLFTVKYEVLVVASPIQETSLFRNATPISSGLFDLRRRQVISAAPTCGFNTGDPNQPRTAGPGFDCRVDTQNALWGFCPTTVISASDCGLAGNCVDSHSCTSGCGKFGTASLTTFTCSDPANGFCSTALLTAGPDQTYSYIACGRSAVTDHLLAAFTTDSGPTSTSSSSSAATPTPIAVTAASVIPISSTPISSSTSSPSTPSSSISTTKTTSLPSSSLSPATTSPPSISDPPTGQSSGSKSQSNNTGAIVGGTIGGIALICFVALAIVFLRKYRTGQAEPPPSNTAVPPAYERYSKVPKKHFGGYGPVELPMGRCSTMPKKPWGEDSPAELAS